MSNRNLLQEELTEENRNILIRELLILEQKFRFDDKASVWETYNKEYHLFSAAVTTFIGTAITGSSLTYILADHRGLVAVCSMFVLWLSLVALVIEKLYSMRCAARFAMRLADTANENPGSPEGGKAIFVLEIVTASLFLLGLLLMGISWCVPY